MGTRDLVVRAAFWHDPTVLRVSVAARLELLRLYAHTDRDGIVLLSSALATFETLLDELTTHGHVATYEANGQRFAWVARSGEQPSRGKFACASYDLPAPPRDAVLACLRALNGSEPTTAQARRACPRAFGRSKGVASGIVSNDVERVFETWQKHQREPSRCRLGSGSRTVIEAALREVDVDSLVEFVDYAFTSADAGPRYWRGENAQERTYLGLDNLCRTTRLAGRIEAMRAWKAKQGRQSSDNGTTLGPLAAYRRRPTAQTSDETSSDEQQTRLGPKGTTTTSPDGAARLSKQCTQILALFRERGDAGVRTSELAEIGRRYGARLSELRGAGFDVYVAERDPNGDNLYKLNEQQQRLGLGGDDARVD